MKNTKVIALVNSKGGVGKTSTAINMAYEICRKGKSVLLVDADPQGDMSSVMNNGDDLKACPIGVLFEKPRSDVFDQILPVSFGGEEVEGLFYIGSNQELQPILDMCNAKSMHRESILRRHFEKLDGEVDFIIIDCPPASNSLSTINAAMIADLFVVPIDAGGFAMNGSNKLIEVLTEARQQNVQDLPLAIFRNEFAQSDKVINSRLEDQMSEHDGRLLRTAVRRTTDISNALIKVAASNGTAASYPRPLAMYKKNSNAVLDYRSLTNEILERLG